MVETKPFKTKLCLLHQKGRCVRETCTFAHGDSELRGFSSSFNDRRINRDNDLRSKLDRKRSPLHRSPRRDAKGLRAYKRSSPSGPSQTSKRRKTKTHEHMDGPNDFSGGFESLEGTVDSRKDKEIGSLNSRKMLEDEAKRIEYEVDLLFNEKSQLEIEMEEKVQEADSLSSRIRDLEAELSEEKDNIKRVNLKIKQFIKAHIHHSQLHDEIKRSQVQLEQLVGELGFDAIQMGADEDKLNANIISDEDVLKLKNSASPARKQLHNSMEATRGSKSANTARGHEARVAGFRRNHFDGHGEAEMGNKRKHIARPSSENKPQLRNNASKSLDSLDKLKASESNLVAPTSMAARADDDFELIEADENPGLVGTPKRVENGLLFPIPPLPVISQNSYIQYEGDDENVDVDGVEELEEVDIV